MNARAIGVLSLVGLFFVATGTAMGAPSTTLSSNSAGGGGLLAGLALDTSDGNGGSSGLVVLGITVVGLVVALAVLAWYLRQQQTTQRSAAESAETVTTPPEEELGEETEELSDQDVVINILESHGGRMKQGVIVEETNWSKSKVSMLLSEMEDEELISKLRVGRENIISLPGHEPDAVGSPFDNE